MLSIVIVSYNTRDLTRNCLASLARHEPGAQVIVVDNASGDGSPEMVAAEFPGVELVQLPENRGFAGANNAGLERSSGDPVVLLNSDTVVEDDSLSRCASYLRGHPDLGALTPRLVGVDGSLQGNWYPFPSLKARARGFVRLPEHREPPSDGWIPGTALVLRREALAAAGGRLDENYFMYWEDADLSARLRGAGWGVATYDGAFVRHYGGASGGGPDAARRADLHAWYLYGWFRWFAAHRPAAEVVGLWLLEAMDVPRCWARSRLRPGRRYDGVHARVLAATLARVTLRKAPPLPGGRSEANPILNKQLEIVR